MQDSLNNPTNPLNTTYYASSNGYTVAMGDSAPMKTPAGLLVTRAVETKDGWKGQVIVDKNIVWESPQGHQAENRDGSHEAEKEAIAEANMKVVEALGRLFGGSDE